MRKLIACGSCKRQFDASALAVGSRFRCRCGETILVRALIPHEAAVVRCRACGATREEGAANCRYCGSDFTLHEQDLHTICPACFARISDRSRFCHHCGGPIVPEEEGGTETDRACPQCREDGLLHSRALGKESLSVLECRRCAGLWLSEQAFQTLRERADSAGDAAPDPIAVRAETASRSNPVPASGRLYRPCPVCGTLMNRFNFGRQSGILLDRCATHGFWFDAAELDATLRWIRLGGERLTAERQKREEREDAVARSLRIEPKGSEEPWREESGGIVADALSWVVGRLFRL